MFLVTSLSLVHVMIGAGSALVGQSNVVLDPSLAIFVRSGSSMNTGGDFTVRKAMATLLPAAFAAWQEYIPESCRLALSMMSL